LQQWERGKAASRTPMLLHLALKALEMDNKAYSVAVGKYILHMPKREPRKK
jgi:hypothetical protein